MNKGAIRKRRLMVLITQPARPKNAASRETLLLAGLDKSQKRAVRASWQVISMR